MYNKESGEPHSSVGSVADLRLGQYFFPKIDDSNCDRIHSSLTAIRCFDNGYAGKHQMAWKGVLVKKKKNSWKAWTGALAAAIKLKYS